ncbi:MAG: serine/threonine-protein phosphatase [Treponema sp.]|nr:serine/threonine-protein phosphatase [Treponema sp.]
MSQSISNLGQLFSPLQVGYIVDPIEPLSANSDVTWVLETIADKPEWNVVPIERDGVVLGVVARKVLEELAGSAWSRFWQKDLDAYLIPARETIEASTYIGKVVDNSLRNVQGEETFWFVVQHRRSYLGVISLQKMLEYTNTLRSQDLIKAGEIQSNLLRKSHINDSRISLLFYNQMAHEIGGDFYRVFKSGPDRYLVACFDVAGKNISGSMATMALGACFSSMELFKYDASAEQITQFINALVRDVNPPGVFVTALLFYVDFSTRAVKIHNCGFSPVHIFVPQEAKKVAYTVAQPSYPPLGIQEDLELNSDQIVPIVKGLRITAYSDGLTDMADIFGERYGEEKTVKLIKLFHTLPQNGIPKDMDKEIRRWIGEASLADDITLVDMRFN